MLKCIIRAIRNEQNLAHGYSRVGNTRVIVDSSRKMLERRSLVTGLQADLVKHESRGTIRRIQLKHIFDFKLGLVEVAGIKQCLGPFKILLLPLFLGHTAGKKDYREQRRHQRQNYIVLPVLSKTQNCSPTTLKRLNHDLTHHYKIRQHLSEQTQKPKRYRPMPKSSNDATAA